MSLARKHSLLASHHHHDVGLLGSLHSFADSLLAFVAAVCESRLEHKIVAKCLAQSLERSYSVGLVKVEAPSAVLVVLGIGHRSHKRHLLARERQHTVVFQQYGAFLNHTFRCLKRLRSVELVCAFHVNIRIVKQSETEFQTQHVAYQPIDYFLIHFALFNKSFQMAGIRIAFHIHIDTGKRSLERRVLKVSAIALRHELHNRTPVAAHHAVPAPLVAKHVAHKIAVGRSRDAVVVVERTHKRCAARFGTRLKRRQINIVHHNIWNPR